jgi:hypothetical protein
MKTKKGIESEAGIVCKDSLRTKEIIYFINKVSEEVEKEIRKYGISEEDRKLSEKISRGPA